MSAPSDPEGPRAAAWLYDGHSAVRHEVTVAIGGDALLVEGFGPVALKQLQRLDSAELLFGRKDIAGWRLGFDVAPPDAILWRLPSPGHYGGPIDRVGLWVAAAIFAVVSGLVVLGAIRGLDLVARAIPYSWEQKLGDAISGDFAERACRTGAGQQALDALAKRLSPSDKPMRIGVVDIPIANAVALPGGRILIFRGLIDKALSPDEVAGVLAHEIGHVEHRHVMIALLRRFGVGLLIGSGGRAGEYGQALLESRYSREAESEADAYSMAHLRQAGISPQATADFFARLGKDEPNMPGFMVYLASHPPSAERRKRFAAAARGMGMSRPALTMSEWAAVRAMCGGPMAKAGKPTGS